MAKTDTKFTLDGFQKNPDGTYSKVKTVPQPREVQWNKSLSIERVPRPQVTGSALEIMRSITLTLFGEPMPKQSVRSFASGAKTSQGKYIVSHYQPAEMKERVKDYQAQILTQLPPTFTMFKDRVHVTKMHFIFSPLKSFQKIKGRMDAIRNGEILYKETKPDLADNLKKLVNDSMSGIVFKDDSIIVSEDNVKKYYGMGGAIIIELKGY